MVGSHAAYVSTLTTYLSIAQNLSARLLLLITKENNLQVATGNAGNAHINANVGEASWSRSVNEWGDQSAYVLEITKAVHGIKTSYRKCTSCLDDALREMGFTPSRYDPRLWMRLCPNHYGCDYIGTFVDDLIAETKNPLQCLEALARKFHLRNVMDALEFFLGSNLSCDEKKSRV